MEFKRGRRYDVIAMGRSTCDMYSEQTCLLKDSRTFARYLGGSPANTAAAMSKLGLKVAFLGCVSDDGMGQFVREALERFGVDVSHLKTDREGHRTAITIGEISGGGKCSSIFYRNGCADLFITPEDADAEFIASSSALLVSGTSLSRNPARSAVFAAASRAREEGTAVIFDPDFRDGTWDDANDAGVFLAQAASMADVVIGTEDEFRIFAKALLPGREFDSVACAREILRRGGRIVVVKHGKEGSVAYEDGRAVPAAAFRQDSVTKTFGAGDSFAAGFVRALIRGADLERAQKEGAAAAAVTISGRSCSDSAPDFKTLSDFLRRHGMEPCS